jgi:tetratricopeptide (TPR) repeat protein
LEQAHEQAPDNLKILNVLAQKYEEVGQFESARKLYQEALTKSAGHPALANNLCFTYYLEGHWQKAEKCYRQILAQDPNNEAARNNLGLLYCRLGRQDEARNLWQEAEGTAAAAYKTRQVLAVLGRPDHPVYDQASTPAPTPVAASSQQAVTIAEESHPQAVSLAPQKIAMQLNTNSGPENPVSNEARLTDEVQPKQAPQKAHPAPVTKAQPQGAFIPLCCRTGGAAIGAHSNGIRHLARRPPPA